MIPLDQIVAFFAWMQTFATVLVGVFIYLVGLVTVADIVLHRHFWPALARIAKGLRTALHRMMRGRLRNSAPASE